MSQWDKLIKRIKDLSKELRLEELKKVLESYGYIMKGPNNGSSHYTFRKNKCNPITIPKHKLIKVIYVKMVKEATEREENKNEIN